MNFDRPPKDASVDNLLELCEVLREGIQTRDKLYESVEQGDSLVRDNIRYGVGLGFLRETDEGVETTSRGVEASYNQDSPDELAEQFRQGLIEYQLFNVVLEELASEAFSADDLPITKSDVLRVFRTSVGLEGSESTLGSAATTFIQTLEAAGLGKYVVGRGGKETRLELTEDFDELVDQITTSQEIESETEPEPIEELYESQPHASANETSPSTSQTNSSPINIKIDLSGTEDPDKVEELIIGIRRGLSQDLSKFNDGPSSEHFGPENEEKSSENTTSAPTDQEKEIDSELESNAPDQSLDSFADSVQDD